MSGITQALMGLLAPQERETRAAPSKDALQQRRQRYAAKCLLLGLEACQADDARVAFDAFHDAFIAYLQVDDRKAASLVQKTIGLVIQKIDNPGKVRSALKHAYRMLHQAGLRDEEARALFLLADFEAEQAAYKEAYAYYEDSIRLSRKIGYASGEAECLCRYAWTLWNHGKVKEAQRRIAEAEKVARQSFDDAVISLVGKWAHKFAEHPTVTMGSVKKMVEKDPMAGVKKAW